MICTVLAEPRGLRHYFRTHFLDTTFKGLYHVTPFDLALLIPYFIVLIILAFYGVHRYQLVYLYYKYRKNKAVVSGQADDFGEPDRVVAGSVESAGSGLVEGAVGLHPGRDRAEMFRWGRL